MNKHEISLCAIAALGSVLVLVNAAAKCRHEGKPEARRVPPLCSDAIRMLCPEDAEEFVKKRLLPREPDIAASLGRNDLRAAALLLSSLIGFLAEDGCGDEKNFSTVLEMLDYCGTGSRDVDAVYAEMKSVQDQKKSHGAENLYPKYILDYRRFHVICRNKRRVTEGCRILLRSLITEFDADRPEKKGDVNVFA